MLRANLLQTVNSSMPEESPMDLWFKKLGGTLYTNCYCPTPDTPRGLGCLYTGLYPKDHGCQKRIQWPKYYLNSDVPTIFDLFLDNQYTIVSLLGQVDLKVGILPENMEEKITLCQELPQALGEINRSLSKNENIFAFLSLPDYHWAMDDYGHNLEGHQQGNRHLSNSFDLIFNSLPSGAFDYIFVFSDHGCKLGGEMSTEDKLSLLNDDRSKIVMLVCKEGDAVSELNKCSDLTSILDVFPTLCELLGCPPQYNLPGGSFFASSSVKNPFIVFEDHSLFAPSLESPHDLWGVRTKDYFYIESLEERILLKVEGLNHYSTVTEPNLGLIKKFQEIMEIHTCSYLDNKKQHEILQYYGGFSHVTGYYSDGEPRSKKVDSAPNLLRRVFSRIKRFVIK